MLTFRTIVLWLHLIGIIVWVGGMIAVPFVVAPVVRQRLDSRADELVAALVRRFQRLSRELVLLILLTGIFNLINAGAMSNFSYSPGYLGLVATKFVLFLVIVANQAWFSLALVPRQATRLANWSAAVNVALAAVVLYLGVALRFG